MDKTITMYIRCFCFVAVALAVVACNGKQEPAVEEPLDTVEEEYEDEHVDVPVNMWMCRKRPLPR